MSHSFANISTLLHTIINVLHVLTSTVKHNIYLVNMSLTDFRDASVEYVLYRADVQYTAIGEGAVQCS